MTLKMRKKTQKNLLRRKILKKTPKRKIRNHRKIKYGNKKGGANNNKELQDAIGEVLQEEKGVGLNSNIPTREKGLIRNVIGKLPIIGNLIKAPEHIQAMEAQQEANNKARNTLSKEVEVGKTDIERQQEQVEQTVKEGLGQVIGDTDEQPKGFFGTVGSRVGNMYKNGLSKFVSVATLGGKKKEIATTSKRIKELATQRQCDSQFVAGFGRLLDTCSKEESINIYNGIVRKLQTKKRAFTSRIMNDISNLKIIDYDTKKEIEKDIDIKDMDLTQGKKDKILRLQENIESQLVNKNLKKNQKKNLIESQV